MKSLITGFTLLICSFLQAQEIDLTGTWYGTSSFLKEHAQLKYELKQTGKLITGTASSKNSVKGDSVKFEVEGELTENTITLQAIKMISRSGVACMADNQLSYSLNNDKETLTGRWSGDISLNTCPPLVSGSITLVKEEEPLGSFSSAQRTVNEASSSQKVDHLTEVLISELNKRKYYALIIGNNQYQNPNIPDLDNPISDAKALAKVLQDYYSFEEENITVLENATREDMIRAMDALTEKVAETDNLLIFYAGHGIWNERLNQGYWLPANASMDSKSNWLSNSTIRDYVGGIPSKHTLLISDACFSGGILKERAAYTSGRAILEVYKMPSRKAMTSGTMKTVPDKSVFIEYLIKNLIENEAPLLSSDELFRSFKTAVINNSPNGQVPQYGPISQTGDEGGDFVFLRKQ